MSSPCCRHEQQAQSTHHFHDSDLSLRSAVLQCCADPLYLHAFPTTIWPAAVAHCSVDASGFGFSAEPKTSAVGGWRSEDLEALKGVKQIEILALSTWNQCACIMISAYKYSDSTG